MYDEIDKCRISGSPNLITVLSLGEQYLTGVFPKYPDQKVSKGPLDLVWCPDSGLLQLKQSYSPDEMYGDNYGYRSGLNKSMVRHLTNKAQWLKKFVKLSNNDFVIDIGSNDATLLKAYKTNCFKLGIDPAGRKFSEYYTNEINLIVDFYSAEVVRKYDPDIKAKIITSVAMFYDLEDPVSFIKDIHACLDDDGIWHFEQSYMPSMLRSNAYDTVCHEHLEFYSFRVVNDLLNSCGLRVLEVQMNAINGGSFAVTACKNDAKYKSDLPVINWMIRQENDMGLDTLKPYRDFEERVFLHRKNLRDLINALAMDGKKVFGYGASTKGNVLLQFCGFTSKEIPYIAEVNEHKFGSFTPGTLIPIISEAEAKSLNPDYFLVLPWHFKNSIIDREQNYLANGGKLIFPLPEIEIY